MPGPVPMVRNSASLRLVPASHHHCIARTRPMLLILFVSFFSRRQARHVSPGWLPGPPAGSGDIAVAIVGLRVICVATSYFAWQRINCSAQFIHGLLSSVSET